MVSAHLKNSSEIGSFPQVGMKTPRLAYPINISQQTTNLCTFDKQHFRIFNFKSWIFLFPRLLISAPERRHQGSLLFRDSMAALFAALDLWLEVSGVWKLTNSTARNSPSMPVNVFDKSTFPYFSRIFILHTKCGTMVLWCICHCEHN